MFESRDIAVEGADALKERIAKFNKKFFKQA